MAEHSHIEWTDATWNPITGCSIVSPGCTNCYAMGLAATRLKHHPSRAGLTREVNGNHVWTGEVRFNEQWLTQPLTWKRPRRVFTCAHGDLFHEDVPDQWIDKVFAVMALTPQHEYQVLTKRSARMLAYMNELNAPRLLAQVPKGDWPITYQAAYDRITGARGPVFRWPMPHIWLGVSAERQQEADARIPDLLATPAAVRFVSAEPLLGPIRFDHINGTACLASRESCCKGTTYVDSLRGIQACERAGAFNYPDQYMLGTGLDWIIVGGESGDGARPMHPDWARSIRDQCTAAGVPFFFKQWGAWEIASDENRRRNGYYGHKMPDTGEKFTWVGYCGRTSNPSALDVAAPQWAMAKVGKARAGRLLDGREWSEMPSATARQKEPA